MKLVDEDCDEKPSNVIDIYDHMSLFDIVDRKIKAPFIIAYRNEDGDFNLFIHPDMMESEVCYIIDGLRQLKDAYYDE